VRTADSVSPQELAAAVDSATTGWQLGDAGLDPVVGSSASEQRVHRLGEDVGLSARGVRVLSLVAQGLSNDEIAARDYLSVNTVNSYIRSAYRKIGVRSRTQAVVWAIQHGFGTDHDPTAFRGAADGQR
jgi:DNA-binding NarL/FixJ family response regulator